MMALAFPFARERTLFEKNSADAVNEQDQTDARDKTP